MILGTSRGMRLKPIANKQVMVTQFTIMFTTSVLLHCSIKSSPHRLAKVYQNLDHNYYTFMSQVLIRDYTSWILD